LSPYNEIFTAIDLKNDISPAQDLKIDHVRFLLKQLSEMGHVKKLVSVWTAT